MAKQIRYIVLISLAVSTHAYISKCLNQSLSAILYPEDVGEEWGTSSWCLTQKSMSSRYAPTPLVVSRASITCSSNNLLFPKATLNALFLERLNYTSNSKRHYIAKDPKQPWSNEPASLSHHQLLTPSLRIGTTQNHLLQMPLNPIKIISQSLTTMP